MAYSRYSQSAAPASKTERDPRAVARGECAQVAKAILLATGTSIWVEKEPEGTEVLLFEGFSVDPPRSAKPTHVVATFRQAMEWALAKHTRDPGMGAAVQPASFSAEQLRAMLAAIESPAPAGKGKALA
jgi:hypothetical protein